MKLEKLESDLFSVATGETHNPNMPEESTWGVVRNYWRTKTDIYISRGGKPVYSHTASETDFEDRWNGDGGPRDAWNGGI